MSQLEAELTLQLRAEGVAEPTAEHRFCGRRWRFDLAWPAERVAVEVQGGIWSGGRHTRGGGYDADCEKLCAAVALGWRVVYVTATMISDGSAVRWIRALLGGEVPADLVGAEPAQEGGQYPQAVCREVPEEVRADPEFGRLYGSLRRRKVPALMAARAARAEVERGGER